jgi:hypothetical protein
MADTNSLSDIMHLVNQNRLRETGKHPAGETEGQIHSSLLPEIGERGKWMVGGVVIAGILAMGGAGTLRTAERVAATAKTLDRLAEAGKSAEAAIGEARVFPHPEKLKFQQEIGLPQDVRALYERSFPVEERQPTDEVHELNLQGKIRQYTVRDEEGNLGGFAFVSVHDGTTLSGIESKDPPNFVHLDFVAVADKSRNPDFRRSNGLGSEFMSRLLSDLGKENVTRVQEGKKPFEALTLEMEDPNAVGLTHEERELRNFRSKVYARLGANNELPGREVLDTATGNTEYVPGYKILDFDKIPDPKTWTPQDDNQPAEFRVFWINDPGEHRQAKALKLAETFYQSESGYDLSSIQHNHPALQELRRLHGITATDGVETRFTGRVEAEHAEPVSAKGITELTHDLNKFDPAADTTFTPRRADVWSNFASQQGDKRLVNTVNYVATNLERALAEGKPIDLELIDELNAKVEAGAGPMSKNERQYVEDLIMTNAGPNVARPYRQALSELYPGFRRSPYDSPALQRGIEAFDDSFAPGVRQLDALREHFGVS